MFSLPHFSRKKITADFTQRGPSYFPRFAATTSPSPDLAPGAYNNASAAKMIGEAVAEVRREKTGRQKIRKKKISHKMDHGKPVISVGSVEHAITPFVGGEITPVKTHVLRPFIGAYYSIYITGFWGPPCSLKMNGEKV